MEFNNRLQELNDALRALKNLRVQLVSADALEDEQKRLATIKEQLEGKMDQACTELRRAAPNNFKAALQACEAAFHELQNHESDQRAFSMKREETLSRNKTLDVDIIRQGIACLARFLPLDPVFKKFISKTPPGRSDGTSEVTSEQSSLVVTLAFTPGRNPLNHEDPLVGLDDESSLSSASLSPLPDAAQIDSPKNIQARADVRVEPQNIERHASPVEVSSNSEPAVASKHNNPVQRMRTPDDWPRWPESPRRDEPATVWAPADDGLYDDYGDVVDDGDEPTMPADGIILNRQAVLSSDSNMRANVSNQKRKRSVPSSSDKATKDSSVQTPKKQRTRGPNKNKTLQRKEVGRAVMACKNTITMQELREGFHKHFIVKYTGKDTEREEYFILRCDVCGVHFNENPIPGARKHLTTSPTHYSVQCRRKGKERLRADEGLLIWRFGIPIQDCTSADMENHNQALAGAIERGDYVIRTTISGNHKSRDMAYHPEYPTILLPRRQERYRPLYQGRRESAPSAEEQASGSTAGAISAITSDIPGPREHDQVYLFAPGEVYWFKGATDSTHRPVVALPYKNLRSIGLQDYDVSNIVERLTSHLRYHESHGYYHRPDAEPKRREWLYPVMYLDTVSENKSPFVLAQVDNTWHFERADIDEKNPAYHRLLRYLDRDELDLTFEETPRSAESRPESTQSAANSAVNPPPRERSETVRQTIEDDSSSESTISNRDYVTDKGKGKEIASPYKASAARRGPGSKPGYRSRIYHATWFNPAFLDSAANAVENTGEGSAGVRAPEAPM